jgi:hypothetical protein
LKDQAETRFVDDGAIISRIRGLRKRGDNLTQRPVNRRPRHIS